jgi:GT2 family glycosyltransferase
MNHILQAAPLSIRPSLVTPMTGSRPEVRGKFLSSANNKLYVRGVTYGPFRPDDDGGVFHTPDVVEQDLCQMAANGINAIRTYTVPPTWLLDGALEHGLWVMIGVPWEQHIAFLDDRKRIRSIEDRVRTNVRACAGHPAVLCYAIGNEIPAPIARWYGHRRLERFLERLYQAAKSEDPDGLVTYVNYPTTEYLQLPFLDLQCFNVYLEAQEPFESYLAHLQVVAGDRPLILGEIGMDSRRNGLQAQADLLDRQLRATFAAGCAGAFAFAWTDEWHRGGYEIEDWDFGLTTRDRSPKPALAAVCEAYTEAPFSPTESWPTISVVVCSYNGSRTIGECCKGLSELDYPSFEVIVVDDGSRDATADIAARYGFRVICTENQGLSRARNAGLQAAGGEIVAYIDDDARPDPHWLTYLAATFMRSAYGGVGGPNIAPPGDGPIAACIENAPGNPTHILLSDREAEHIPGCNMAFRKDALEAIGGFDPQFRTAGDDVDVCWRLQQQGWTLGFSPAAMVWHHRRNSVKAYWKQQLGYGKAEALLERKWPEKYNLFGHSVWRGRLYDRRLASARLFRRWRIYQGVWGSAPFQPIHEAVPNLLLSLLAMPEWYLVIAALAGASVLGALWPPLLLALPLLVLAAAAPLVQAGASAARASFPRTPGSLAVRLERRTLTALLHLLQPLARLLGRLRAGLTPWRRQGTPFFAFPWPRVRTTWCEHWQSAEARLASVEAALHRQGIAVTRGGDFDQWDLQLRAGFFGLVRILMATEEHGGGRQLVRFHSWPRCSLHGIVLAIGLALLTSASAMDGAWLASAILGAMTLLLAFRMLGDYVAATGWCLCALEQYEAAERVTVQDRVVFLEDAEPSARERAANAQPCDD